MAGAFPLSALFLPFALSPVCAARSGVLPVCIRAPRAARGLSPLLATPHNITTASVVIVMTRSAWPLRAAKIGFATLDRGSCRLGHLPLDFGSSGARVWTLETQSYVHVAFHRSRRYGTLPPECFGGSCRSPYHRIFRDHLQPGPLGDAQNRSTF